MFCDTSKKISGLGHSMKRKEDARFTQGKGNYVDDIKLPGMLYMDIVRSPYAHAKILSIDSSEALKIPGVIAVVTGRAWRDVCMLPGTSRMSFRLLPEGEAGRAARGPSLSG